MRSRRSKRGVGAILAASFMLLILVLGFSVFLVIQAQMGEFQESVGTVNTLEFERARERLIILGSPNSSLTADLYLNLTVENQGFIDAQILFVGIFNRTVDTEVGGTHNYTQVHTLGSAPTPATSILLNPGQALTNITHPLSFTIAQNATVDFTIQLVTARGTVATVFVSQGSFASGGQGQPGPKGEPGTGFGLPYTLLLDTSASRQAIGSSTTKEITFFVYGTNISGDNMTDLIFYLSVEEDMCSNGELCSDKPGSQDTVFVPNATATVKLWNGTELSAAIQPDGTQRWKVDMTSLISYLPKGETILAKLPFMITTSGQFEYFLMKGEAESVIEDTLEAASTNDSVISVSSP